VYDRSIPFGASIKWIKKETRDTWTYALKISDREIEKTYSFQPGQFNMLSVPGIGQSAISISSGVADHDLLHTLRVAGDVTTAISKMRAGDVVGVKGPFGKGWPMEETENRNVMIIAGGVGIAPLRSVIRQLSTKQRACPGKDIILYGAKTPKDIVYRNEFPRYRDMFHVFLTVDKADPEEYWKGEVGLVSKLLTKASFDPLGTVVFICGPEVMMQSTIRELLVRGVADEKIYLSMERNMNCGMGICGHCFFGPKFVCKDGPVFKYADIEDFLGVREV
jgi:NAD(P)H-flavin reductase